MTRPIAPNGLFVSPQTLALLYSISPPFSDNSIQHPGAAVWMDGGDAVCHVRPNRLDSTRLFSSLLLMIDLWKCDPIYTFNLVALCRKRERKRERERERERNKEMTVKRRRERELGVLEHSSKSNLAQGSPISPSVPPCPIGALGLDWTNWLTLAQLRLIEPAPRTIDGNTERRGPYHLAFKRRYSLSRSPLRQLQGR